MKIAIGTYTINTKSHGIYILDIDIEKKTITPLATIPSVNPSFIHFNASNSILYAVKEVGNFEGELSVLRLDILSNDFEILSSLPTQGSSPCHITVSPDQKCLIVSNYSSGNFVTYDIAEDGTLKLPAHNQIFEAASVHPDRQKQSHIHSAIYSSCGKKVFVQDLGGDFIYQFDADNIMKKNAPYFPHPLRAGSGPRLIVFLRQAPIVYILSELESAIDVYSLDRAAFIQSHLQHISLNDEQYKQGSDLGAHIKLSDDEKFLYASNRGDKNIITVFSIQKDYTLELIQCVSTAGNGPRHFEISPDQKWTLVANQYSNSINIFKRDKFNGKLQFNDMEIKIPAPACIKFI